MCRSGATYCTIAVSSLLKAERRHQPVKLIPPEASVAVALNYIVVPPARLLASRVNQWYVVGRDPQWDPWWVLSRVSRSQAETIAADTALFWEGEASQSESAAACDREWMLKRSKG